MIEVKCSACNTGLWFDDEHAGQMRPCPQCGAQITVPTTLMPPPMPAARGPQPLQVAAPGKGLPGIAIAAIVLGCLLVPGAIMVAILVPVINSALRDANRSRCQTNLKAIGTAVLEYDRAYEGRTAPGFDALIEEGYLPEFAIRCPAVDDKTRRSYFYFPVAPGDHPNRVIVCDWFDNHDDGRAYLTRAGNVAFTEHEQFDRIMSFSENHAFAEALRQAEAARGP